MKKIHWTQVLAALLVLKLLFHFYLNGQWSFHRDELLYLALGRHLDWGYASVPAGIGFWSWIVQNLLGASVWGLRLFSTIFGTLTVFLTALIAVELSPRDTDKKRMMFWTGLAGLTCGAFLRPCMLFMPVVFDIFYWTLLCWLFLKYINQNQSKWLLWFGLVSGIGLLNKYSVLIFLFAMVPGLMFAASRKIFSDRYFYAGTGLALLVMMPNIFWQAARDFPVFRHMGELAATQFANVTLEGFFMDQILFFLPLFPVWLAGLYFLLFDTEATRWRIFGWMYLMVLLILILFSAKSYYSLGAYPVLIAAGMVFLQRKIERGWTWLKWGIPVFILLTGLITLPATLPVFPPEKEAVMMAQLSKMPGFDGILRWEDGRTYPLPQDFADMIGWKEIGEKAGEIWRDIPDKSNAGIYAENYGQAGAIELFGKKSGVTEVYSFSDNYQYWLPDSLPDNFSTLIYVNDELGDDMPGFFEKIEKVYELEMPLSRQHGDQIYLCQNPTPAFFQRMNEAFREVQNH